MAHVLLIIPTQTYRATDFVRAAGEMGVEVSVAAEEELPLVADDRQVWIDCSRPEWSAQLLADHAARLPVDAIVPLDDQGVVVAARAAQLIGLPHNPPAAAAATRNKAMMRRRLAQDEVSQPRFAVIESGDSPARIASRMGLPVVLKPLVPVGRPGRDPRRPGLRRRPQRSAGYAASWPVRGSEPQPAPAGRGVPSRRRGGRGGPPLAEAG